MGFDCQLVQFNGENNHVHLLISASPKTASLAKVINALKSVSSRRLRNEFADLAGSFSDKLPPPNLTVMDGDFVRPMLNIINTSRYRTCTDRTFCMGTLYESAVSQQVSFGIVAKIRGDGKDATLHGLPSIHLHPNQQRSLCSFMPLCPRVLWVQCVSYGWRITWYSLKQQVTDIR